MYESHFNFSAKPFQLSPDPKFFFNSRGHNRALSYLRYGVEQGEGFIVITGDIGTGKTTLARALFEELNADDIVAAQIVTTQLGEDDLLKMVAASFNIQHDTSDKAEIIKKLNEYLLMQYREGRRVLLLVDEAQNLPPRTVEELRMLSNFQVDNRALLQSFLLGQKEFRNILQSPDMEQLRQRVIAAYHLSPLDLDETRKYIEHRLTTVGWNSYPIFSPGAFVKIYEYTRGVPRKINNLCDRLLLFCFLEEKAKIDSRIVSIVTEELMGESFTAELSEDYYSGVKNPEPEVKASVEKTYASENIVKRLKLLERKIDKLDKNLKRDKKHLLKAIEKKGGQPGYSNVERFPKAD